MQINSRPLKDTTVLVYTSASADLEKPISDSLDELSAGVHRDDIDVVAQMGSRGQAVRSVVSGAPAASTTVPGVDMAKPAALTDFLRWGMQNYPAKNYVVVMGGHGTGSFGCVTDSARSHMMPVPELAKAIGESGCRPQMVVFNACLMAQAEVATELAPVTPVVVGSQTAEKGLGMPLGQWLQSTPSLDDPNASAALLVKDCAAESDRVPDVAAIRTGGMGSLETHLKQLSKAIVSSPDQREHILGVLGSQPHLWDRSWDRPLVDQVDLGGLAGALAKDDRVSPEIKKASQLLLTDLHKTVTGSGLSIYAPHAAWEKLPTPSGPLGNLYEKLRLPTDTGWAHALGWLVGDEPQDALS